MNTKFLISALLLFTTITVPHANRVVFAHGAEDNIRNETYYYRDITQKNRQAVVFIKTEIDPAKKNDDKQENDPAQKFMPRIIPPLYKETILYEELGLIQSFLVGTGFIITPDGEILTNYHVIDAHKEISIMLFNGNVFNADVVGIDKPNDLALLKINTEKSNFPFLTLGNSDVIMESDKILIIGHPLGINFTVSSGTISGLKRTIYSHPIPLIQIQSSLNPGNSGSPLIDVFSNKVIGIIQSMIQNANQIGFAIPINPIKKILPSLRNQKIWKNNAEK